MTPKRSRSPTDEPEQEAKRRRSEESMPDATESPVDVTDYLAGTADSPADVPDMFNDKSPAIKSLMPTQHSQARTGIQRSIALVLKHDGFESASPEAIESFTEMVETYLEGIIDAAKSMALASRREHPIPTDFEHTLRRHNISIASLKPHLRPPVSRNVLAPTFTDPLPDDKDAYAALPLLSEDLSGQPDKDEKEYIPSSFPDFPSKHTYKFTAQEDTNIRDPKKIRIEAARTAQQGEDALRRLVRASKMRKQKEVKNLVERDVHGKERFRLWESTMKRFMATEGRGENVDQMEIADHSMIVNGEALFARKEIPRLGKRSAVLSNKNKT